MVEAPIHGVVRILRAAVTNTPVDEADYSHTHQTVIESDHGRGSLRRILVGPNATRQEGRALSDAIQLARDFVSVTQDSSQITEDRSTAAIACLNILLAAGGTHNAYNEEAARLVGRANPNLFSRDPLGNAAKTLYSIATLQQIQLRGLHTMKMGLKGLERKVQGLPNGADAALKESERLAQQLQDVRDAEAKGVAERFFTTHTLDEEQKP